MECGMKNNLLKVLIMILTLISTKTFANEMDRVFYWSNAKGFVKADHCKFEASNEPKFGIVYNFDTDHVILEKNGGVSNLTIVNASLVKTKDTDISLDKFNVEVVSINTDRVSKPFSFGRFFSKSKSIANANAIRGDEGLVGSKYLKKLQTYIIKLNNKDYVDVLGGALSSVYHDDKFVKLNCPEFLEINDYTIFDIYSQKDGRVVSRVGVSLTETEIFKEVSISSKHNDTKYNSLDEISFIPKDKGESLKSDPSFEVKEFAPVETNKNSTTTVTFIPSTPVVDNKPAFSDPQFNQGEEDDFEESTQSGMSSIICTPLDYINVRNENLDQVLFTAKAKDRVNVFQGWGNNGIEGYVDGKLQYYIKGEFLDREASSQKIGYVVSTNVSSESDCNSKKLYTDIDLVVQDTSFTGLDDKGCCIFPTLNKVTARFNEGKRRFGALRDKGARIHAAADLYRYINEPIFSVAPGVVISDLYFFYQGTYALEVMHSGGFVVRYGELTGERALGASYGKQLEKNARIGYMGKVNSGCCEPMLHFELYSGKLKGPLTEIGVDNNGIKYNRRRDLLNPTKYLLEWQNEKF